MSSSDGVTKETECSTSELLEKSEDTSFEDWKNIPPEKAFLGFERMPVVRVARYDITPYLKPSILASCRINGIKKLNPHFHKLTSQCVVKLAITDSEIVNGNIFTNKVRRSLSTSSSDAEKDIMSSIKCKTCGKLYSSEKKLRKHQEKKHIVYKTHCKPQKRVSFSDHVIVHEVKEYHKCRKCPKIFVDYKFLKTHMKQSHKKRKCYICNYCNKSFVDRLFFKIHIKLHCDVCGLLLRNKVEYNNHRRNVCRVFKTHRCRTCNEEYFKFMDLKDHSYEHITMCYVCDICKDQFETKCAVSHHIAFLHSNKRPTTLFDKRKLGNKNVYLCNFCGENNVERNALEKHVQSLPDLSSKAMTGYNDYYFCDQCLKKFDTETDMMQHKWSHYLKTSDNSQERMVKKTTFKYGEPIPDYMQPSLILERVKVPEKKKKKAKVAPPEDIDLVALIGESGEIKKPIVNPKSKKTIISRHQCVNCGKYYSSNYCLNRHIETQHSNYENLQCKVCEETFVWPSLLKTHKCIRLKHPEMPFQDARPEIHFENLNEISQNGFDDFNIGENENYNVDFEIPAPVVELTELNGFGMNQDKFAPLQDLGYKLVIQEVPIEF